MRGTRSRCSTTWPGGELLVWDIPAAAVAQIGKLMQKYASLPMDLADASLVWLATETGVTTVMTLDARDFSRYRLPDGRAFEIL